MSLDSCCDANDLYLARGQSVNICRPFLTGDVFDGVAIPGAQEDGRAIVIAHPCSMRGRNGALQEKILCAAVKPYVGDSRPEAWENGYYSVMPLPHLLEDGQCFGGLFNEIGLVTSANLDSANRIACLSVPGINILQQRLIYHLTRLEVRTFTLHDACCHTFEEADLLEEWNDSLTAGGISLAESTAEFEELVRRDQGGGRTLQGDLQDAQRRASVRATVRAEARTTLASMGRT